ncbi:MAG: hypothetical protein QE494_12770 [Ramlibacter sp.]|uniref:hypothetical protein n=1 Tax=Ramlibacter sp. TaxID=1917967 RepID=UPI00260F4E6C|nr:hypothetical protein [Ramlibacter sp.]MDH4377162.1 hypothetical protein [Ramlibacter sp.]
MLTLLVIVKLISEIALMCLFGRWVLGLLAGAGREQNLFYQVLDIAARPFLRVTRFVAPGAVLDRHVPLVAFLLLGFAWLLVTLWRIQICVEIGVDLCR